jgi:uncharacterized protein
VKPELNLNKSELKGGTMKIIDFRARPNIKEYMNMFPGTLVWDRYFRYPKPEPKSLSEFIAALDKVGITQAVFTGRKSALRNLSNDVIVECLRSYPERLFAFAGANPHEGTTALKEMEEAITKWGMKGLALDPHLLKLSPDDGILYPFYYKCIDLDVPVILTMGPLVGKWGNPAPVDKVAEELPKLKILCSHGVWPQVTELIALAYRHENVYLEASIYEFMPGAEPILQAANTILQDKVLYASGFPFRPLDDIKRFLEYPFDKAVVEKLVYGNAARLLKI